MVTVTLAFQSLLTFAFLYGLIFLMERGRSEVDPFLVAVAAIAPMISAFLLAFAAGIFGLPAIVTIWIWMITLIGVTFLVLLRTLQIPVVRAVGYTIAVFVFGLAVQGGMFMLS
jgi:hypothetical protein